MTDRPEPEAPTAPEAPNPEQQALDGLGQLNMVDELEAVHDPETAVELAHQWIGLPMFQEEPDPPKVVITCESEEARDRLLDALGIPSSGRVSRGVRNGTPTIAARWPNRGQEDLVSLRFAAAHELNLDA